ncbi:serine/threonine-protein kinase [Couchioplanes caeruleus]|uniref:serine/threonine-protein kinase n=1 Tax=Couchioplanes caeruleus TaxID=56438 RepID=UPI0023DE9B4B|nr:serine/threonine-protein kinase [Couchioplanes caeruleus]
MEVHQRLGGRYVLLAPLGRGGMSVVWRARDEVLGRTVAVKVLAARHMGDPESRRRIHQEARAAAGLSHPNIAQVYDYGESSAPGTAVPYIVMELVRGVPLHDRMHAPMSPRFAMRVCAEVAAALAAAHADGLVHRDIKPANVLLAETGAKVVDFGIAAAISRSGTGDLDAEVYGTPAYLAPERLTDDAVDPASDVYALGVLLYRLLSGHSPWSADTTTQMLSAHIYVAPEPLPQLPGVPEYVVDLCNRCLNKDVTLRPSAREAAALLAQGAGLRVVADEPFRATGATAVDPTPSVLIRRDATTAATNGAAASGAAAGGAATSGGAAAIPVTDPDAVPLRPAAETTAETADTAATSAAATAAAPPTDAGRAPRRRVRLAMVVAGVVALAAVLWLLLPGPGGEDGSTQAQPVAPASSGDAAAVEPGATTARKPVSETTPATAPATAGTTAAADPAGAGGTGGTEPPRATVTTGGATATTTTPRPTATTDPEEPPAREWSFSSSGGSVRASCPEPGRAQLLSWTAARPWKVDDVEAGPAAAASATFRHGNERLRMTVTCSSGTASVSTDDV